MKRFIIAILVCSIALMGASCAHGESYAFEPYELNDGQFERVPYNGLNDPNLLRYVEGSVFSDLTMRFDGTNYRIENVTAGYMSKEYLEEVAYNSQTNIFFGYTLDELDAQFQGTRYVFTLGADGETEVVPCFKCSLQAPMMASSVPSA